MPRLAAIAAAGATSRSGERKAIALTESASAGPLHGRFASCAGSADFCEACRGIAPSGQRHGLGRCFVTGSLVAPGRRRIDRWIRRPLFDMLQ